MTSGSGSALERLLEYRGVQLMLGVLSCAIAGWLIGSGRTQTLTAIGVALVATAALVRWPAFTAVSLLIVCQELDPAHGFAGPSASGLLFIGHQFYFTTVGRISVLVFALLLAAGRVAATTRPSNARRLAVGIVLGLGAYCAALVWADGASLTSAINQNSLFAILFAASFVIGVGAAWSREWQQFVIPVMLVVVSAVALIGLYLAATGQGASDTGTRLIFYDSAMGAIAGAVVLAVISMPASQRDWRIWWLGGAALVVVILSARRNIWAAMAVALLLGLMFGRNRVRLGLRVLSAAAVVCVLLAVFQPSVMRAIGHQLAAIWEATQGTAADSSTHGHLSDISIGWAAVKHSPITGVGPNGHVAGLVVEANGPLYIHNQVLESWLRFGLVGAALVVAFQIVLLLQGLLAIRRPRIDFSVNWAAQLLVLAPAANVTAPFLTQTLRWPAIVGFAAGLVATVGRAQTPAETTSGTGITGT